MIDIVAEANHQQDFKNKGQLSITIEVITPERAREYLTHNFKGNRTPSKTKIAEYAYQMASGEWGLSDGIQFDENGHLIDGQHRLHATIKADIPVAFYVIRGVETKAKEYINIAMSRSASNIAEIRGIDGSTHQTLSIARRMTTPRFGSHVDNGLSKHEVVDVFMAFYDGVMFSTQYRSSHSIKSGSISAVIARAYYHENHQELARFLMILNGDLTPFGGLEDSAPCKLRDYYLENRVVRMNVEGRRSLFYRTQSALSAFLAKKPLSVCREKNGNLWPIPELDDPKKFEELRAKLKSDPTYRYV
jgi:hypothetical protein